jgi:hypothetical protein
MSENDLLRTIIKKSIVLSNFYECDPSDNELDELNSLIKKDTSNLELEDIVLEKLNKDNIVSYWNFVYKYDFHDKIDIKRKIHKYVRNNNIKLEMDNELISNQVLLYETCINQDKYCETTFEAAERGHLECLRYLHKNGCKWDAWSCIFAALNGHLECLKYLHENGCKWDEFTCAYAAKNGHLECLRYAHENGCKWNRMTCRDAAENGHLECLRYAHENGCEWDEFTCAYTADNGHLECLMYLHENGCEWYEDTCIYAEHYGHLECLKYACENKCPGYEKYIDRIQKN